MHPLRAAVEAKDHDAIVALLADDVVFTSPVAFKPYPGKAITAAILHAVNLHAMPDLRYVREISAGDDHMLEFVATVGGREINGVDLLHTNADGLIDDFKVMVRPLSAAKALSETMAALFPAIEREAVGEGGTG